MNGIINIRTAYPTSKPYTKFFSVFGSVVDNPNKNDYIYDDATQSITGKYRKTNNGGNWTALRYWGGVLGRDTTINNPFTKRPYDFGFSFAEKKLKIRHCFGRYVL